MFCAEASVLRDCIRPGLAIHAGSAAVNLGNKFQLSPANARSGEIQQGFCNNVYLIGLL